MIAIVKSKASSKREQIEMCFFSSKYVSIYFAEILLEIYFKVKSFYKKSLFWSGCEEK